MDPALTEVAVRALVLVCAGALVGCINGSRTRATVGARVTGASTWVICQETSADTCVKKHDKLRGNSFLITSTIIKC